MFIKIYKYEWKSGLICTNSERWCEVGVMDFMRERVSFISGSLNKKKEFMCRGSAAASRAHGGRKQSQTVSLRVQR